MHPHTMQEDFFDLEEELAKATETKAPGGNPFQTHVDTAGNSSQTPDPFWGDPGTTEETQSPFEEETGDVPGFDEQPKGKLTEKAVKTSAAVATGMIDLTQRALFTPILRWKFKRNFSEKEVDRMIQIEDHEEDLPENDLRLKRKWDRLLRKLDKNVASIGLTNEEEKDLQSAFENYFKIKQIDLPPGWLLAFAVINTTGKRTLDVFFD